MLFTREFKEAIRAGKVTRTYRRWKRPQAKVGGRYDLHPEGTIEVTRIQEVAVGRISAAGVRKAGFSDHNALLERLAAGTSATVYQIDFRYLGTGHAKKVNTRALAASDTTDLLQRLGAMDRRAGSPWVRKLLTLIRDHPGTRAAELAPRFSWETPRLKAQVRKLKALGLTISLETGYRLSARGRQILRRLESG